MINLVYATPNKPGERMTFPEFTQEDFVMAREFQPNEDRTGLIIRHDPLLTDYKGWTLLLWERGEEIKKGAVYAKTMGDETRITFQTPQVRDEFQEAYEGGELNTVGFIQGSAIKAALRKAR